MSIQKAFHALIGMPLTRYLNVVASQTIVTNQIFQAVTRKYSARSYHKLSVTRKKQTGQNRTLQGPQDSRFARS